LIAGWIACWLAQSKWRRSARDTRRELVQRQAETTQLRHEIITPPDSML
jgi:hypothetical protein